MTAREEVLARVRAALGPAPEVPDVPRAYRAAGHGGLDQARTLDRFVDRLEDYRAVVHRVDVAGLAAAVADGLGASARVVVSPGLPDAWRPHGVEIVRDEGMSAAELDDVDAVLTGATVAIAETGTIVLDGSADQGRRAITLVPDRHVCVVHGAQVVDSVPDAIRRLDPRRPQVWISGPSATSDIELDRVEGVHGPRALVVVVVDPDS